MAILSWPSKTPSPEETLTYAGIVAANCPGECKKEPDGFEVVTDPVIFDGLSELGSPYKNKSSF